MSKSWEYDIEIVFAGIVTEIVIIEIDRVHDVAIDLVSARRLRKILRKVIGRNSVHTAVCIKTEPSHHE